MNNSTSLARIKQRTVCCFLNEKGVSCCVNHCKINYADSGRADTNPLTSSPYSAVLCL